jgi:glycosyltransferase involved in cell wall biosynthesis
MRVVYLSPLGQLGGAEICLIDMLASLRAAEPDWQLFLVVGENGPLIDEAKAVGVPVIVALFPRMLARLGDSKSGALGMLWSCVRAAAGAVRYAIVLGRILRKLQPDVIHTNGFKMHVLGAWARPKNAAVVWHVHDYVSTRPLMKRLLRIHAGACAAAIGNSMSVVSDIEKVCGPKLRTSCIYNAVDLKRYCPADDSPGNGKTDLDSLAGLAPPVHGTIRIGLVATLAHWKGHEVFLRALARLPQRFSYRGYVIGGAIYQTENSQRSIEELRELAAKLGIGEKTGFTGYLSRTGGAIRALDILVHASTQPEPFGRVIAEGMACGRAVICSAAGGAAELITEGQDALAHAPGDDVGLSARMQELIEDGELRARLGRAGRITAERRFDPIRLSRELIPLYRRAAGASAPKLKVKLTAGKVDGAA